MIGDALGSEATDSGHVIPTTLQTFRGARRAHFPLDYQVAKLTRSQFDKEFGSRQGVADLMRSLDPLEIDLGFVSAPGQFDPDAHSRGVFWICVFVHGESRFGRNVLVRFERVET